MNSAERLLNDAADYIAATLEQPADTRAWTHLLIYCPKELIIQRAQALASLEGDAVERVALAAEQVNKWPPLKMALWGIVTGENLNDGHYINAYDLTDKLYAAILATGLVAGEADRIRHLEDLLKRVLALGETGGWRRMPDRALFSSLPLAEDIKFAIRSGDLA